MSGPERGRVRDPPGRRYPCGVDPIVAYARTSDGVNIAYVSDGALRGVLSRGMAMLRERAGSEC